MDANVRALIDQYGVTDKTKRFLEQTQRMFINGEFIDNGNREMVAAEDPSTGDPGVHPGVSNRDTNVCYCRHFGHHVFPRRSIGKEIPMGGYYWSGGVNRCWDLVVC